MFGYVAADPGELTPEEKKRYESVYCGICRQIRERHGQLCRLGLSYDMAFLSLLLMSLYEPEEESGSRACSLHPLKPRCWVDNEYIRYGADMNVALAYYKSVDDREDDGRLRDRIGASLFQKQAQAVISRYPRQCRVLEDGLRNISRLEKENCPNPDAPAGEFGRILGELFVYREDLWQRDLRGTGEALGRFIYLADAMADYKEDAARKRYNPFLAMGGGENRELWDKSLILTMSRCTESYERLPLVQDKKILDNVLYSGVWRALGKHGGKKA